MSVVSLIADARAQGVTLYLEGNALKFRAHGAPLSPELKARLQAQKAELVAFLSGRQHSLPERGSGKDADPAPLTHAQQRMYFLHQADDSASHYNMAFAFDLKGPIDAAQLETAIRAVLQQHAVLRSTYDRDGDDIVQKPNPATDFSLKQINVEGPGAADNQVVELSGAAFDLATDFPLRVTLITCGDDHARLSLVFHHIAFDGWSYQLFLDALSAELAGQCTLPPPYQIADIARWQQSAEDDKSAYWQERLEGVEMLNALPADRARNRGEGYRGRSLTAQISAQIVARMDAFAGAFEITRFSVMQAVLAAVVARWTGRDHAVIGTPVSGRGQPAFDGIIGLFVNTLPLRTDVDPNQKFESFVKQADAGLKADLANQDVPLDQIVNTVSAARDPAFPPLLQILFALGEPDEDKLVVPGCKARACIVDRKTVNFELEVHAQPEGDGITLRFGYAANLFDAETITAFAESYVTFLEAALETPEAPVGRLPIVSSWMTNLMAHWNDAEQQIAPYDSFPARFARQVAATPDAIACRDTSRSWTYRELDNASGAIAADLIASGAMPGDFVGLSVQRGFAMVLGIVAILKTGAAYVPLDARLPEPRLDQVMADCAPKLVVGDHATPASLKGKGFLDLDKPRSTMDALVPPELPSEQPAYAIFTSGTTGRPKGVVITHGNLSNFLSGIHQLTPLGVGSVIPLLTAISFDVHVVETLHALANGATIALPGEASVTDPAMLAASLKSLGATDIHATPATWQMLIDAGWRAEDGARLYSGGDALPDDLKDRLLAAGAGLRLWNYYGPTEATVYVSATRMQPGRPVSVGRAMPGNGFHVLNTSLVPMPAGVVGRLYLSGENLAHGYLGLPALTASRFPVDPQSGQRLYDTGDLARWSHDGQLQILGRADFQVKIRGHRVELGEVETLLSALPNVKEAVAVASPDGNALSAFVRPVQTPTQMSEMSAHLSAHLPAYMIPAQITGLAEMPVTASNKIDRTALSLMSAAAPPVSVPAATADEKLVECIWRELLGLDQIDVFASFFELGGHSLLAIRMLGRVEARTGTVIPLRSLLMAPTISGIAQLLSGARRNPQVNDGAEILL